MVGTFVDLRDVSVTYESEQEDTIALRAATLGINRGEFIAVVGPSGCGKSTLLKVISGLRPASAGAVLVDGMPVVGPLKIIGMAFQNAVMLPWRTVLGNVLLPLEIVEPYRDSFKAKRAEYAHRANALLSTVGLAGFGDRYPWQLSGGMQQRASLCRALIHQPDLMLLDEPFGALDQFTREELWDVLQALWLDRKFTVVLITHDLREAVYLADTVYIVSSRPGRITNKRAVPLPRPRSLADSFKPEFVDIVHELREGISAVR